MIKVEPILQIRSRKIIAYTKFTGYHFRTESQRESAALLRQYSKRENEEGKQTYSGEMKAGTRKRLIKAIDILVQTVEDRKQLIINPLTGKTMPFRLAFTTLTIHSPNRMIDAKEAYKNLLSKMLQWLRRSHNVYLYIWKAELQTRKQLHYHLLLGSFVPMDQLRKKWNALQAEAGYLDEYFEEHGHYDAPSTEICNTIDYQDTAGYLIKEISKNRQNESRLTGKVWDCSTNLKEAAFTEVNANKYGYMVANRHASGDLLIGYQDKSCVIYKVASNSNFKPKYLLDNLDSYLHNDNMDYIKTNDIVKPKRTKTVLIGEDVPRKVVIPKFRYDLFNNSN